LRIKVALDRESLKSDDRKSTWDYVSGAMVAGIRAPMARRKWDFDFEKLAADLEQLLRTGE
jgi:hypothetical protein